MTYALRSESYASLQDLRSELEQHPTAFTEIQRDYVVDIDMLMKQIRGEKLQGFTKQGWDIRGDCKVIDCAQENLDFSEVLQGGFRVMDDKGAMAQGRLRTSRWKNSAMTVPVSS
jgi:hypothetical protein